MVEQKNCVVCGKVIKRRMRKNGKYTYPEGDAAYNKRITCGQKTPCWGEHIRRRMLAPKVVKVVKPKAIDLWLSGKCQTV